MSQYKQGLGCINFSIRIVLGGLGNILPYHK
jgi:hypothetical protein